MFNRTYTFINFSAFYATYTALLGPARLLFLGKNCYLHVYLGSTIIRQVRVNKKISKSQHQGNQTNKKAVAIVRPQPQQVISGAKNNNSLVQPPHRRESIDREARFSLYDFPSDSEGEDGRPSSSASSPSKSLSQGKKSSPKPGFKSKQQPFSSVCNTGTKT